MDRRFHFQQSQPGMLHTALHEPGLFSLPPHWNYSDGNPSELLSFLFVLLISLVTATALWFSSTLAEILEPWLVILNSLPKSALAPLLIVWLGASTRTIITAGMSVAVFGSIISVCTAFQETDEEKIKLIYTLGGTRFQVLKNVVFPSHLFQSGLSSGLSDHCAPDPVYHRFFTLSDHSEGRASCPQKTSSVTLLTAL